MKLFLLLSLVFLAGCGDSGGYQTPYIISHTDSEPAVDQ